MNQSVTNWDELAKEASRERRQGRRLNLAFPIEIRGVSVDGAAFAENARTEEVSETGCRIKCDAPVNRGDVVSIRLTGPGENLAENEAHPFEVMWVAFNAEGRYIGARKMDDKKFWRVNFPSTKSGADSQK